MSAPLFLIGFMAAGKTSVGRALGGRFVDLDDEIAREAGEPVAALVARDEAAFRAREAAVLARWLAASGADDTVIATGGGAATWGDNLGRMRSAGLVVALGVDLESAQARTDGAGRPLFARAAELLPQRDPVYRRAHAVIETSGRSIDEVAAQVRAVQRAYEACPDKQATFVALGERTYPIVVADRLVALGELVPRTATKLAIITDRNVAQHHLARTQALLGADAIAVKIEPGEGSKSFATYENLCADLVARGLDRGSAIVALGGGVVGDIAGFVAATLFRGIPVVQVPTTLVAMTDSAIGGKTAIDLPAGKNLVGAFHQPALVACPLDTLATLPARERRAGFGELWKYALLDGTDLWAAVAAAAPWAAADDLAPAPPALADVIGRAIAYKAAIVSADERERTGRRAVLNLGHTVGHAIEAAAGLLHGEAVGLGLLAACRVSAAVLGTSAALEAEVAAALTASGLPAALDPYLTDEILARVAVDKKRHGTHLRFLALRGVGVCQPVELPVTELRRILRPVPAT
ncbi:MAG TPA: 3-dehydroquinate synthase [Kofleriaceae bacterium]